MPRNSLPPSTTPAPVDADEPSELAETPPAPVAPAPPEPVQPADESPSPATRTDWSALYGEWGRRLPAPTRTTKSARGDTVPAPAMAAAMRRALRSQGDSQAGKGAGFVDEYHSLPANVHILPCILGRQRVV
ncbi:MAG: hypothetical protein HC893_12705 [Chloroflexaceae bacterium]|nr:hypothetical protein [Chloroflexaceae bacterium]